MIDENDVNDENQPLEQASQLVSEQCSVFSIE